MKEELFVELSKINSCLVNEIYIFYLQNRFSKSKKRVNYLKYLASLIVSYILFLINIILKKKISSEKEMGIGRVDVESEKIKKFNQKIQIISDNIKKKDFTVYRIGNRISRIYFMNFIYWKRCIEEYNKLKKITMNPELNIYQKDIINIFLLRIPHSVVFEFAMDELLKEYSKKNIYIGSMYERFSLILEEKSRKYGKKMICIPHGLEFMEKLPKGFVGDVVFCSSKRIKNKLNEMYNTKKFYYNFKINEKIYRYSNDTKKLSKTKKIVYFTQPIEIEKSLELIGKIANFLKKNEMKLYIKVHPLEKIDRYQDNNIEIIKDIKEAINDSCCISYCSTILLEALYNDSVSITSASILKSEMSLEGNFEFLKEKDILKPQNIDELFFELEKYLKT